MDKKELIIDIKSKIYRNPMFSDKEREIILYKIDEKSEDELSLMLLDLMNIDDAT